MSGGVAGAAVGTPPSRFFNRKAASPQELVP